MIKNNIMVYVRRLAAVVAIAAVGIACMPSNASASVLGSFELRSRSSYMCMTVAGGAVNSVQPIVQRTCNRSLSYQRFQIATTSPSGTYVLHPRSNSSLCLGMAYNIQTNGILLQQQACNGSNVQKFWITTLFNEGSHAVNILQNYATTYCMQNDGSWDINHYITQWVCDYTAYDQKWETTWLSAT
jgi:hypothetical protein